MYHPLQGLAVRFEGHSWDGAGEHAAVLKRIVSSCTGLTALHLRGGANEDGMHCTPAPSPPHPNTCAATLYRAPVRLTP